MEKIAIPKNGDPESWQRFIEVAIPRIEESSNERGLSHLRNRIARAAARLGKPNRVLPVNPARYEGRMGDFAQYVFEHPRL